MKCIVGAFLFVLVAGGLFLAPSVPAQNSQKDNNSKDQQLSDKERKKRDQRLMKELETPYKKWLNEDVVYIITPEERQTFLRLQTNEEREQFIEQFWLRRDPTPDTPENEFKEEHYRRIAYANQRFSSGVPGWKTDRGRIYIMWGPPDEINSHPSGGAYERTPEEGGGSTSTYPFEDWRYRYLEGMGNNVELEFVDITMSGEYRLTIDPCEKDALARTATAGLTTMEAMGESRRADRFSNPNGTTCGKSMTAEPEGFNEFTRLELYAKIFQAPPVKFKDLEAVVSSRIVRNTLPFDYRFDFFRITSDTILVPITVQIPNRSLSFQEKNGVQSAALNLFARVTTIGGRIVQTFEDVIARDFPDTLLEQSLKGFSIYQKAVPLRPGLYRLDVVIKDVNSGNVGVVNTRLAVPRYDDDKLASSDIVLADDIQRVSSKEIGVGQFVLGDVKVRPKMDRSFMPEEHMGIYMQVYNLRVDERTHKPDAAIEYRVVKNGQKDAAPVFRYGETTDKLGDHGEQITLEKTLALTGLAPGKYKLEIQITDNLAKQTISPTAEFTVKPAPK